LCDPRVPPWHGGQPQPSLLPSSQSTKSHQMVHQCAILEQLNLQYAFPDTQMIISRHFVKFWVISWKSFYFYFCDPRVPPDKADCRIHHYSPPPRTPNRTKWCTNAPFGSCWTFNMRSEALKWPFPGISWSFGTVHENRKIVIFATQGSPRQGGQPQPSLLPTSQNTKSHQMVHQCAIWELLNLQYTFRCTQMTISMHFMKFWDISWKSKIFDFCDPRPPPWQGGQPQPSLIPSAQSTNRTKWCTNATFWSSWTSNMRSQTLKWPFPGISWSFGTFHENQYFSIFATQWYPLAQRFPVLPSGGSLYIPLETVLKKLPTIIFPINRFLVGKRRYIALSTSKSTPIHRFSATSTDKKTFYVRNMIFATIFQTKPRNPSLGPCLRSLYISLKTCPENHSRSIFRINRFLVEKRR